jgi:hypothetical protein
MKLDLLQRVRVFENTVLRKILRPKKEETAKSYLYFSPYIIRVIKSRRMGHTN